MPRRAPVLGSVKQDRPRKSSTARGYDYRWQKARAAFLMANPLCVVCRDAHHRIREAREVDHIEPHQGDMVLFWDRSNWQALCRDCHLLKSAQENAARASILPAWLPTPAKPLIVVCGPPRAGKTTHVSQHAGKGDLVLDLDAMAEGKPLWRHTDAERNALLWLRNRKLARFCEGRTRHPRCWLIATAGTFKQRKFWADKGAEVVVVNPGHAVCVQRILADESRPPHVNERLVAVARKWE